MEMAKMRATRVEQREVVTAVCPICGKDIVGVVEAAIYMGEMKLAVEQRPIEGVGDEVKSSRLEAAVVADTSVELRSMTVKHQCVPADVAAYREVSLVHAAPNAVEKTSVPLADPEPDEDAEEKSDVAPAVLKSRGRA